MNIVMQHRYARTVNSEGTTNLRVRGTMAMGISRKEFFALVSRASAGSGGDCVSGEDSEDASAEIDLFDIPPMDVPSTGRVGDT
jgi:hypothetical protein